MDFYLNILSHFSTLILVLDAHDNSVKVRNFSTDQFIVTEDFVKIQLIIKNLSITQRLSLKIIFKLSRMVRGIKHQN